MLTWSLRRNHVAIQNLIMDKKVWNGVIEEEDKENERKKKKPRKSEERPDTIRQNADRFSIM